MSQSLSIKDTIKEYIESRIEIEIKPIKEVKAFVESLFNEHYRINPSTSNKVVEKHLHSFLETLRDDLYVLIESPYVDKMYRDAYYHYYSSKLKGYQRDCIRLSFFNVEVKGEDFRIYPDSNLQELQNYIAENYLGFLVLRPTFPKIIGRNAISPKAKKNSNIVCCLSPINATISSVKQSVLSFPHASQDNQTMTCAETTIWSLIEYFGNKYPDYKPVLLSHITKLLQKYSFKRLLPSEGLTAEQITFALREFGFGSMIYSQKKLEKSEVNIDVIISTYVESGIPIVGVLKNTEIGHVVNIVGRETEDRSHTASCEPHKTLPNNLPIIEFNKITRNYVFIDDNHPPYQVTKLDRPCEVYYTTEKWHSCKITNVIVPLYNKIYLDAARATKNFYNVLEDDVLSVSGTEPRILKIFLASSRSYKSYIALNEELNVVVKELVLALSMPKFIWIAELSKKESYIAGKCDEFYIQDATEPVEFIDMDMSIDTSLIAAFARGTFFVQNLGKFKGVNIFEESPFDSYKENLK